MSRRIPQVHIRAMQMLAKASTDSFNSIHPVFSSTTAANIPGFIENVCDLISESNFSREEIEELVNLLASFYITSDAYSISLSKVTESALEVIKDKDIDELNSLTDTEESTLKERLETLLSGSTSLQIAAKRNNLKTEHENLFIGSRIITDVRPVFSEDISSKPISFIILNTIKMDYVKEENKKTIYLTLDSDDIDQLIDQLNRAKTKTETLTKYLED